MSCLAILSAWCLLQAQPKPEIQVQEDVVFAQPAGQELELDLAYPVNDEKLRPGILYVHGGGWQMGTRKWYSDTIRAAAERGYVAVAIDYRFAPAHPWPAQMEDVRAGLAWMHEHAKEYRLDTERIGVMGDSAGAHLALMLGLSGDAATGELPRVRAVVNYFGPTDFVGMSRDHDPSDVVSALLGGSYQEVPDRYEQASPLTHVTAGDPPVISLQGTVDKIVPFEQATRLHRALRELKVPNRLRMLHGQGHVFEDQGAIEARRLRREFFDEYLKGSQYGLVFAEDFGPNREPPWSFASDALAVEGPADQKWLVGSGSNAAPVFLGAPMDSVADFTADLRFQWVNPGAEGAFSLIFGTAGGTDGYSVDFGPSAAGGMRFRLVKRTDGKIGADLAMMPMRLPQPAGAWHRMRLEFTAETGHLEAFVNDMENAAFTHNGLEPVMGRLVVAFTGQPTRIDAIRIRGRAILPKLADEEPKEKKPEAANPFGVFNRKP